MTVFSMLSAQMPDWRSICEAYAKKIGAELLFVNSESFGIQVGECFSHIYIDELIDILNNSED